MNEWIRSWRQYQVTGLVVVLFVAVVPGAWAVGRRDVAISLVITAVLIGVLVLMSRYTWHRRPDPRRTEDQPDIAVHKGLSGEVKPPSRR